MNKSPSVIGSVTPFSLSVQTKPMFPRQIFRAYDIRANTKTLNHDMIVKIGYALAEQMRQQGATSVVLGYDARLTSQAYAHAIAQSLSLCGLDVIQIGCVSSPVLYFTALKHEGYGIMLTASHNAVTDNGIKWLLAGLPPTPQQIQQIADTVEANQIVLAKQQGQLIIKDALSDYYQYLQQDIQLNSAINISVEGLHGSAGEIAKQALLNLGCEVDALHCNADGNFPLGAPDPSDIKRLETLKKSVLEHQSVMGIALDGDGDRLVLVDEQGNWVSPDRLLSLLTKICLLQHPHKTILCDVKCSSMVIQTAQKYQGECLTIRTGSSFLRNHLASSNGQAIFGGEFAGHYVFNDGRGKGYDDGLYAALRILEYLQQYDITLSQALAEFPERIASTDVYIDCESIEYAHLAQLIKQHVPNNIKIIAVDGIRLDFPFGFGIMRPSNTGEYFTVRFDADSVNEFNYIRQLFVEAVVAQYPTIAKAMAVVQPIN